MKNHTTSKHGIMTPVLAADSVGTVTETPTRTVEVTAPPEVPGDTPGEVIAPGEETETYFSTEGQEGGVAGLGPDMEPVVVREQPAADVTGVQDDAQAGERLFITVREDVGENGREYTVDTVERTLLCHRGVSGGLCL
ncbi:MAG: hypothetical protein ACI38U_06800 [Corynebacterium sp.]|uniref:hypothetical protein n=1 Tax=Corynebacterium sp. TaxID=1720 RepID=UPI003F034A4E